MEDQEIVRLYLARDESAVAETDFRYGHALYNLSMRILDNREDAQENRNDTYMKTWESIPPAKPVKFGAYILRICRNLALNRIYRSRTAKRSARLVELTRELANSIPDNRMEENLEARETGRIISAFLRTLPKKHREMMVARSFSLKSIPEIAAEFGCSEGSVRVTLSRVRRQLKEYLEKEGITI